MLVLEFGYARVGHEKSIGVARGVFVTEDSKCYNSMSDFKTRCKFEERGTHQ